MLTQITERIRHRTEVAAIVRDGKISLNEVAKLDIKDQHTGLLIADELFFNGEPDAACGGAKRHNVIEELKGDGGIHPGAHGAPHGITVGGGW